MSEFMIIRKILDRLTKYIMKLTNDLVKRYHKSKSRVSLNLLLNFSFVLSSL